MKDALLTDDPVVLVFTGDRHSVRSAAYKE